MGIEEIIAIAAIAASAAGTGAAVHQSQAASAQAKDAGRDQQNAVNAQNTALAGEKAKVDATTAARAARTRQLALAGSASGYNSTISAPPVLGGSVSGPAAGKQKLGE